MTLDGILEIVQYARPRFGLVLFSVFAGIGLVLVTIGVYSVVSWTVTQQRHEIGIRLAKRDTNGALMRLAFAWLNVTQTALCLVRGGVSGRPTDRRSFS